MRAVHVLVLLSIFALGQAHRYQSQVPHLEIDGDSDGHPSKPTRTSDYEEEPSILLEVSDAARAGPEGDEEADTAGDDKPTTAYMILGVPEDATDSQIRKAYFKKARKEHPDKNGGTKEAKEKFQILNEWYEKISEPENRQRYDAALAAYREAAAAAQREMKEHLDARVARQAACKPLLDSEACKAQQGCVWTTQCAEDPCLVVQGAEDRWWVSAYMSHHPDATCTCPRGSSLQDLEPPGKANGKTCPHKRTSGEPRRTFAPEEAEELSTLCKCISTVVR
eukprot:gnl/TRDRNA2_/TRDRNA2_190140_c0_seq1.p1 gnl/TRDRNA2_/TRDRNA2_190140_c0~~gnl/TRDRNA2_/TRDRNA2_190140_c0_seq1.p1  ORF type:complete len:297 (+),score=40.20 gnl/TRDRNA2_/TRDRNA2_190140_c0_seq1:53-892(+)